MAIPVPQSTTTVRVRSHANWLTRYYGVRALFSAIWVGVALTAGRAQLPIGAALLVA